MRDVLLSCFSLGGRGPLRKEQGTFFTSSNLHAARAGGVLQAVNERRQAFPTNKEMIAT